ncbi:UpxY family transcription antiterminator [Pontibacter locisalis]|uniref:UpxY family transcription antiterminator n=1 Tax=Pontibacter locisalis TaxID=1719035 RepID=A0ABW5IPF5_9BACT
MSEKWYAVYTKPRWEKKVAESLAKRSFVCYCPLNKVVRQWSDRKKTVLVPLFNSYVFVFLTKQQIGELKKIDGILQVVTWLGQPAVIKDEEIATIKRFLNEYENIQVEKTTININDSIKITNGLLTDTEGTVVATKNNMIKVALPSLGYTLFAEVDRINIKKVTAEI